MSQGNGKLHGAGVRTSLRSGDLRDDRRAEYRELRAENRLKLEQIRGHRLAEVERREKRRRDLAESLAVDWVAPYIEALNVLRSNGDPVVGGPTATWQRRHGKNWPIFQTEQELALYRAPARTLLATNGYAQGLVEGLTSYVLGPGCTYRMGKATDNDDLPQEVVDAAQGVVDSVLECSQWFGGELPGIEEELFGRSIEDGEWILCHYPQEDGNCEFRIQEPEQLTQPPGSDVREWGFGVYTRPNDPQKPLKYWLQFGDSPSDGEEYEPDEVTHFRRNVRRGMKRGFTDFAFDTYDGLYLAGRLRTNLADTAAQQAAIVGVRQWENATKSEIEAFNDEDADYTQTDPASGRSENVKLRRRGGWEDVPRGFQYVPGPIASTSPIHIQVLDACLRGAGCRWNAPPWLMSGDLNAMNYATSLTAESPFVKTVQRRQRGYCEAFRRPIWFALRHRIRTRGLRDKKGRVWSWEEVGDRLKLTVTAPSPETRNKLEDAQRASIEIGLGVQSRQAYMQEQGRDGKKIEADNQEHADKFGDSGQPLPDDLPAARTITVHGPGGDYQRHLGARAPTPPSMESLLESEGPHKFSSTHVCLTGDLAERLLGLGRTIPDRDLAEDGREDEPHVTVRYGLHTDDPANVSPVLEGTGPVSLRLGRVSVFPGTDSGKPYDVLKVDVESDGLRGLNEALAALPHTDTFADYKPHATIAYVKAGLGEQYAARMGEIGADFTADRVVFSNRQRQRTEIPLGAAGRGKPTLESLLMEHGFTGTDRLGRKWVDGKEVAKDAGAGAAGTDARTDHPPPEPGSFAKAKKALVAKLQQTKGGRAVLAMGERAVKIFHAVEHRLLYAAKKTQEVAVAAAKERGLSEEGVAKLKRALYVADFLGGYATGGAALAVAGPVAGKVAAIMPSASVAYLAYSAAKNPRATWRAAKKVIADTFAGRSAHESEETPLAGPELAAAVADRIDRSDVDSEWWLACFCAALAHTGGDARAALELADAAAEKQPSEPGGT